MGTSSSGRSALTATPTRAREEGEDTEEPLPNTPGVVDPSALADILNPSKRKAMRDAIAEGASIPRMAKKRGPDEIPYQAKTP